MFAAALTCVNKPGIGGSSGNWLEQRMEDRAQETIAAINWAKALPMIDTQSFGLWGGKSSRMGDS